MFNFNFNYQHTTRCLDCGEYIYKQLHLARMHISLYYLLCNSAPWWWSSTTETCRSYTLRKNTYHLCILLVFISNYTTVHGVEYIKNQFSSPRYRKATSPSNIIVWWLPRKLVQGGKPFSLYHGSAQFEPSRNSDKPDRNFSWSYRIQQT